MPSCMVSWTDLFCDPPCGLRSFDIETWLDGITWFNQVLKKHTRKASIHGTVKKKYTPFISVFEINPPLILTNHPTPIWSPSTTAKPTLPRTSIQIRFVARIKTLINSPATWKSWGLSQISTDQKTSSFFVWLGDFFGLKKRDRTKCWRKNKWTEQKGCFVFWKHGNDYSYLANGPTLKKLFGITCLVGRRKCKRLFHGLFAE